MLPPPREVLCLLQSGRDESARFALLPIWLWVILVAIGALLLWALWMGLELRAIVAVLVAIPLIIGFWAGIDAAERRQTRVASESGRGRERIAMRLDPRGAQQILVHSGATELLRRRSWKHSRGWLVSRLWRRLGLTPWLATIERFASLRRRMSPEDRERFDSEMTRLANAPVGGAGVGQPHASSYGTLEIGATPGCRICGGERMGVGSGSDGTQVMQAIRLTCRASSRCVACGLLDPDPVLVGRVSRASVPVALWMMAGLGALGVGSSLGIIALFLRDVLRGNASWLSFAILAPILVAVMGIPSIWMIRMVAPWRHRQAGDQVWTLRDEWCEIEVGARRRAVPWSSLESTDGIVAVDGATGSRSGRSKRWSGIRLRRHDAGDEHIVVPCKADRDAWLQAARARAASDRSSTTRQA